METRAVISPPFKPWDFARITSMKFAREFMKVGDIIRITRVEQCKPMHPFCEICERDGWNLGICVDSYFGATCDIRFELYKGPIENTRCFKCKDYLFCTIRGLDDKE